MIIKQYGMYRSGTNLVAHWLNDVYGLSIRGNDYGHKHDIIDLRCYPGREIDGFGFVVCFKNPYAFAVSFARMLSVPPTRELARWCAQYYERMFDYWSAELPAERTVYIPFERILTDPASVLTEIEATFGLTPIDPAAANEPPLNYIDTEQRDTGQMFDRRGYYQERRYLDELTDEAKTEIGHYVNWDVIKLYGYTQEA